MTTTIGFTAARELPAASATGMVTSVLACHVPHADQYVTGGARGGDAFIGRWLYLNRPAAVHSVIIPADRSQVDPWWERFPGLVTVIEMLPGTTYADRNQRLVDEATWVFGFPAFTEFDPRSQRSGTWQTIRMARKAGNFSQWHCVQPPYPGRLENYPDLAVRRQETST